MYSLGMISVGSGEMWTVVLGGNTRGAMVGLSRVGLGRVGTCLTGSKISVMDVLVIALSQVVVKQWVEVVGKTRD